MQLENASTVRPEVIVRAWGDEPVRLFLHRIEKNRCFVGIERAAKPIGLPFGEVFVFDVDRFSALCTAFKQGDASKLGELWANIQVDDFACNKYQDMITCLHDQEHITDPEGASCGNSQ
ncbi:MAG TPA: hypothetical protein VFF64_05965 [Candidatus Eremiobacteraceae bacterium]|nr:hypothetical protein [Candidatus Eremiobacteraceae bacterium]